MLCSLFQRIQTAMAGKILARCPVYILVDQTVQKRGLAVVKPETEAMYGIF